ncbi:MAG: adenylate/guanylate cyclase domain-containing protein [Armatimonadota bacterium]
MLPEKRYILFFAIALLITMGICFTPVAEKWELWSFDYRLNITDSVKTLDDRVRIIGIDVQALEIYGQWPWARKVHAEIVDKLSLMGVNSVAYDILFDTPSRFGVKDDEIFALSLKKSGRVILPFKFEDKQNITGCKILYPVPIIKDSAASLGFADSIMDIDGKLRKAYLAYTVKGKIYPSLDLAVFAFINGIKQEDIKYSKDKITVGTLVIPTDKNYSYYINFADEDLLIGQGLSRSSAFDAVSVKRIMDMDKSSGLYKGSVCFVGATDEGLKDYFTTPVGYISGVAVHANILNSLIKKYFIRRAGSGYEALLWILLIIIGIFVFPKTRGYKSVALFISLLVFYIVFNFILFSSGWWLNLVYPLIYLFIVFSFTQSYQFAKTRKLFGQFVAQEFVDEMLDKEAKQKLGGEEKEVTVLFSDIRGYTDLSEKMEPKQIMELLNQYHSKMGEIFAVNKGRIFDYQGDAQMVVFGAPAELKDHAYFAVKAAWQMKKEIENLKSAWREIIPGEFSVGIGLCTGRVAVGLVGAEEHKQYVAIGDSTNTASRLQGLSGQLGCSILMTESTYLKVKDRAEVKVFENISIKGKAVPVTVYGVTGIK